MSQVVRHQRSAFFAALLCLVVTTMLFIVSRGGISVGYDNHAGLMPVVRRILDPNYLPGDFNIALRLYHHRVFAYLIALFTLLYGEDRALVILNIAGMWLLAWSLWSLSRTLGLSWSGFLAASCWLACGVMWCGRGLELNQLLGNSEINPTTYAHALTLFSISALLRERYARSLLFAGLSLLFHLQVGLITLLLLAPFYLPLIGSFDRRQILRAAPLLLLPASLALLYFWRMLARGVAGGGALNLQTYNEFRQPHHFELWSAGAALWVCFHLALQAVVWWRLSQIKTTPRARMIGALFVMSLITAALSLVHFLDYYVLKTNFIIMLQFVRLSPLITLFGTLALIVAIDVWAKPPLVTAKRKLHFVHFANFVLIACAALWAATPGTLPVGRNFVWVRRYAAQPTAWSDVCDWVGVNTAPAAVYLTPPGNYGFTYLTNRSTVVEYKINPDGGQYLEEWYERLRDMAGGALPSGRGFANNSLLNNAYAHLSDGQLRDLARKYHASYAVLPVSSGARFPVLYANRDYKVVRLD